MRREEPHQVRIAKRCPRCLQALGRCRYDPEHGLVHLDSKSHICFFDQRLKGPMKATLEALREAIDEDAAELHHYDPGFP